MRRILSIVAVAAIAAPLAATAPAAAHPGHPHDDSAVLVFTDAAGRRSADTIRAMGRDNDFDVTVTQDAGVFTATTLTGFNAVVFLNTTGDVLDAGQRAAFEAYVQAGNGFVGVHAAAETEPSWTFYQNLVGATATAAAPVSAATVTLTDRVHPSTKPAPRTFTLSEPWYTFDRDVRGKAHILATTQNSAVSWCQDFEGGRSWYTGLGHSAGSYGQAGFRKHLLGGIQWAAGQVEGDCGATVETNYEKVTLNDEPGEPMTLAVLPDGRVLHNTRNGVVRMYDPGTGLSPVIAEIPVYQHDEDGLQSVAVDADFARNKWVYIYYAPKLNTPVDDPATPSVNEGDAPVTSDDPTVWDKFKGYNQLSRVKLAETPLPHLDMATEQRILRVDTDRGNCCHVAGEVKFDGKGQLYLVTGDDTNAGGSDGFTPINESPTQGPAYDAQRSAANTNDLRGKVLRIKVRGDGSYSVPGGNLFPESKDRAGKTRPEIFLMGLRNPFRFDVSKSGYVYVGDYSPDSRVPSATRGPEGTGRWIATNKPGNYGWPYCYSPDLPYIDFDFVTRTSGAPFNCADPVNESPRNTGLKNLPPVRAAQLDYTFNALTPCPSAYLSNPPVPCGNDWPVLGTGGVGPMGGPEYSFVKAPHAFPEYYDDTVVFGEFTRDKLFAFRTDGKDKLLGIEPLLTSFVWDNPMDMEFGPDGQLYVLEYGDGFFRANPDAQLSTVRYVKDGRSPEAHVAATPTSGQAPLTVRFSSDGSTGSLAWDFDGNGTTDSTVASPSFTYTTNGVYNARLTATDEAGRTAVATRTITVGNTAPAVRVVTPANGSFFEWGDTIPFTVEVTDPEDGPIDCSRVEVSLVIGHDEHGHGINSTTGCSGSLPSPADGKDHAGGYLFLGVSATYADLGGLSTTSQAVVQTWRQQAENAAVRSEVAGAVTNDVDGDQHLTAIDNNDYIAFRPIDLGGVESLTLRVAGGTAGAARAAVEVRLGSPTGELVTTATVQGTGGNGVWTGQSFPISHAAGEQQLYLVFKALPGGATTNLFNLNWIEFA